MTKILGFFFFALSWVAWGGVAVLFFLDVDWGEGVAWGAGLIVVGELSAMASTALLGKHYWPQIKERVQRWMEDEHD